MDGKKEEERRKKVEVEFSWCFRIIGGERREERLFVRVVGDGG